MLAILVVGKGMRALVTTNTGGWEIGDREKTFYDSAVANWTLCGRHTPSSAGSSAGDSSLTASPRFDGALNVDITEFQVNLGPYPR